MCGIVGIIGDMGKDQRIIFSQLLYTDTLRGFDSTGIVSVGFQGQARIFKKAVAAPDFIDFPEYNTLSFGRGMIGHNRWATKGAVNNINAHPFHYGPYAGVHNGTLRNQSLLPDSKDFKVDSENIYHSFEKIGVDETIAKLHGAYALVWYNEDTQQIQMVRNSERPLHYAFSKDKKHVYYASEKKMLEWILDRNKVEHKGAIEVKTDTLYSFDVLAGKDGIKSSVRKVKPYVPPVSTYNNNVQALPNQKTITAQLKEFLNKKFEFTAGEFVERKHYGRDYFTLTPKTPIKVNGRTLEVRVLDPREFNDLREAKKNGELIEATISKFADSNTYPTHLTVDSSTVLYYTVEEAEEAEKEDAPFLFEGFEGEVLTEEDWKEATKGGCAWCASPAVAGENNLFLSPNEFVCEDCRKIPEMEEYLLLGGTRQ